MRTSMTSFDITQQLGINFADKIEPCLPAVSLSVRNTHSSNLKSINEYAFISTSKGYVITAMICLPPQQSSWLDMNASYWH